MKNHVAKIKYLRRYPVKSMKGYDLKEMIITSTGALGDRVYAFVDKNNHTRFPWMTARQSHSMLLFEPRFAEEPNSSESTRDLYVRTPEQEEYKIDDPEFLKLLQKRFRRSLSLTYNSEGNYDASAISIFSLDTAVHLSREIGIALDHRRFRANLYIETVRGVPFLEESWVGKVLTIGESVKLKVTQRDPRCAMITFDPDTTLSTKRILSSVVRNHEGCAGVYATVLQPGVIHTGDSLFLES